MKEIPLARKIQYLNRTKGVSEMGATVVSLINMKGGVGKTTLTFNLAWYAAYKCNLKVLTIDLDPQSNLSQYLLGADKYKEHVNHELPTVFHIFEQFTPTTLASAAPSELKPESVIHEVRNWNDGSLIHLVPSQLELCWTLRNPTGKDHLLAKFLSKVQENYDLVLIDCAPTESILTMAAYRASRYIIVPVKPEFLATIGLPLLERSLDLFKKSFEDQTLEIAGIVFNDADPSYTKAEHNKARNEVRRYAGENLWYVFENEVRHSDSYPRGARFRRPIFLTDYAKQYVKDEFNYVGEEFMIRVGL